MSVKLGWLQVIQNYNIPKDCCCEKSCSNKATKYATITIDGLELFVMLCEEHARPYEDSYYTKLREAA